MNPRFVMLLTVLITPGMVASPGHAHADDPVRVASKSFTESVILGEILAQLAASDGTPAQHLQDLGGSAILWSALLNGEIDAYPEYTGTILQEHLATQPLAVGETLRARLATLGLAMSDNLGFNNTYVLGMKEAAAARLGIRTVSDLRAHPALRFGFSNEFMERGDGWPALRDRYGLPHEDVRGLEHSLCYEALEQGKIDVMELYSTDAEILQYELRPLVDDLEHFPRYDAVILYRQELSAERPGVVERWRSLAGRLDEARMVGLNRRGAAGEERAAAREFLGGDTAHAGHPLWQRLRDVLRHTVEHITLVVISLLAAILVAVPLGVFAARFPGPGRVVLGFAEVVQTVPALALLVLLIPLFGLGALPALVALFLYSLLPILRNTHAGLLGISGPLRESAEVLGLDAFTRLRRIELPLAAPSILTGIQISAVINVGTATLGGLIGAGGYGQLIMTGIRRHDDATILAGALPAALLALVAQGLFAQLGKWLVPAGLRLDEGTGR